ncbi:MAG: bacitracin ABC transporter permease, partial [Clostridium sp.]
MKIFSLTYNELVKQFKKTSVKVIIALILLTAIILPIGLNKFESKSYEKRYTESNQYLVNQKQSMIDELKNDKTAKASILRKIYEVEKAVLQLQIDYKVGGMEDWKATEIDELQKVSIKLIAIEEVLEGVPQDVLTSNIYNVDTSEVAKYYDLTLAKKKEVEAKLLGEKEEITNIIKNNDYMKHTEMSIRRLEGNTALWNEKTKDYETLLAKNPKDEEGKAKLEAAKALSERAKLLTPRLQQEMELLQFRLDNKINYEESNWKHNSIVSIEKELFDYRVRMLNESEFSTQAPMLDITMTYDEYVENYKSLNNKREEKMKELWYGLENNIPNLNAIK